MLLICGQARLRGILAVMLSTSLVAICVALPVVDALKPSSSGTRPEAPTTSTGSILIVGSVNVDIIVPVNRLPHKGETLTSRHPAASVTVGGKGANQAVAVARLTAQSPHSHRASRFMCRFGNDSYATMLESVLDANRVDISGCTRCPKAPSGQGIVMLEPDGSASSIVVSGSNIDWPLDSTHSMDHLFTCGVRAVLLQREIPAHVNLATARAASRAGVPILLDMGGEDRPVSNEMLRLADYVMPNESELGRLVPSSKTNQDVSKADFRSQESVMTEAEIEAKAAALIARGARSVLVTLGRRGAILVRQNGSVVRQEALPVPGGVVVDATAAGDAFRAAFTVALVEGKSEAACLRFGAAAGAVAASRLGALPSLPTRSDVLKVLGVESVEESVTSKEAGLVAEGDSLSSHQNASKGVTDYFPTTTTCMEGKAADETCNALALPLKFASRLNSMKARRDLISATAEKKNDVFGWIARQAQINGLDLVNFNFPQHLAGRRPSKVQAALRAAGLTAGAVCIRFPEETFSVGGAFSNPDSQKRAAALSLAVEGCVWAAKLGARDLIVWPQFDGYDYNYQMDYPAAWKYTVDAFRQLADACPPGIRVSLEFKPTDESTRFLIAPSSGAALSLAREVDRPNFGLTLDLGHMLMAGENPAQSVALVGTASKLFGMQLNDAHVKLGAEDGLAFGAINPVGALELVTWLRKVGYDGHIYFDTFPRKEDPVREAEYNIRQFKAMWKRAGQLAERGIDNLTARQDALGILELLEETDNRASTATTE